MAFRRLKRKPRDVTHPSPPTPRHASRLTFASPGDLESQFLGGKVHFAISGGIVYRRWQNKQPLQQPGSQPSALPPQHSFLTPPSPSLSFFIITSIRFVFTLISSLMKTANHHLATLVLNKFAARYAGRPSGIERSSRLILPPWTPMSRPQSLMTTVTSPKAIRQKRYVAISRAPFFHHHIHHHLVSEARPPYFDGSD